VFLGVIVDTDHAITQTRAQRGDHISAAIECFARDHEEPACAELFGDLIQHIGSRPAVDDAFLLDEVVFP
jgi:hypothetical protein